MPQRKTAGTSEDFANANCHKILHLFSLRHRAISPRVVGSQRWGEGNAEQVWYEAEKQIRQTNAQVEAA